jgi:hypothetical protein
MKSIRNIVYIIACMILFVSSVKSSKGTRSSRSGKEKELVKCNMCVDPNEMTKPDARILIVNLGFWTVTIPCRHRYEKLMAGVGPAKCAYHQSNVYVKTTCGCTTE